MAGSTQNWRLSLTVYGTALAFSFRMFVNSAFNVAQKTAIAPFLAQNSTNLDFGWSLTMSLDSLGAVFGTLFLVQILLDSLGRQKTILLQLSGGFLGFASCFLAKIVQEPWLLFVGRFAHGLFMGSGQVTQPIFFSEISPIQFRGRFSTSCHLLVAALRIIATVVGADFLLETPDLWHYIPFIACLAVFPAILFLFRIPDSPPYLFLAKRQPEAAEKSLIFYQKKGANFEQVSQEWQEEGVYCSQSTSTRAVFHKYLTIFGEKKLRGSLILCLGVVFSSGFSAGIVMIAYSMPLLTDLGMSQHGATISITVMHIFTAFTLLVGGFLLDRLGRRPVLLVSVAVNALSSASLCAIDTIHGFLEMDVGRQFFLSLFASVSVILSRASASGILLFFSSFTPEVYPLSLRSTAKIFYVMLTFLLDFFVVLSFLPVRNVAGPGVFALFSLCQWLFFVLFKVRCPETARLPVHEAISIVNRLDGNGNL